MRNITLKILLIFINTKPLYASYHDEDNIVNSSEGSVEICNKKDRPSLKEHLVFQACLKKHEQKIMELKAKAFDFIASNAKENYFYSRYMLTKRLWEGSSSYNYQLSVLVAKMPFDPSQVKSLMKKGYILYDNPDTEINEYKSYILQNYYSEED